MTLDCRLSDTEISLHRDKQNELNDRCYASGSQLPTGLAPEYSFTNENQAGYYESLGPLIHDQRVLAICGGGDFSISAITAGAEELMAADRNPSACFLSELKAAALSCLSYKQFLAIGFVEREVYTELRDTLSDDAQDYFDRVVRSGGGRLLRSDLRSRLQSCAGNVPYLQSKEAYDLACRMRPLTKFFYQIGDFTDVATESSKVGVSYISNIYMPNWTSRAERDRLTKAISQCSTDGALVLAASQCGPGEWDEYQQNKTLFIPFGQVGFDSLVSLTKRRRLRSQTCQFPHMVALQRQ